MTQSELYLPNDSVGLFERASIVRDKAGVMYAIVMGPDLVRVETTSSPAYAYRALSSDGLATGALWIRSQDEMESDFELVSDPDVYAVGPGADDLLASTMTSYEAEIVVMDNTSNVSHLDRRWDCTKHLTTNFTMAEVWEILSDQHGSILADGLRRDPIAPKWVREFCGEARIHVRIAS